MESLGNANHAVSVVGKWIFDSNYEEPLPLKIKSLNFIYSCYEKAKILTLFDKVFYAVRYVNPKAKKKCA